MCERESDSVSVCGRECVSVCVKFLEKYPIPKFTEYNESAAGVS